MSDDVVIQIPMRCSTYRKMIDTITLGSMAGIWIVGVCFLAMDSLGYLNNTANNIQALPLPLVAVIYAAFICACLYAVTAPILLVVINVNKLFALACRLKVRCMPDGDKP